VGELLMNRGDAQTTIEELIAEDAATVTLRVTEQLLEIFHENRVSFGWRTARAMPTLRLFKGAVIEQYADWTGGGELHSRGSFSYQMNGHTNFPMGRYCSVGTVRVLGERHQMEHVTMSPLISRPSRQSMGWAMVDLLGGRSDLVPVTVPTKPVPVLEHDVWIGIEVLLARGIRLGTGCVVGSGAVVTKDVPPYAIVAGNPARIIRMRFSETTVSRLLLSRWWELHPRVLFDFDARNPDRFLDQLDTAPGLPHFSPKTLTWEAIRALIVARMHLSV
jgi:virginiamycin A acetyltransferase